MQQMKPDAADDDVVSWDGWMDGWI